MDLREYRPALTESLDIFDRIDNTFSEDGEGILLTTVDTAINWARKNSIGRWRLGWLVVLSR